MKRRVLVISPYFYPEGGGLEKYAFDMAMELLSENEVNVLCMTREEEDVEEFNGIKVHRIKPDFIISNTPLSLKFILTAAKMVKEADLVITHTPVPFAADVASFLAKLRRIPVKIVYHTVGLKKGFTLLDFISKLYSATVERLTLKDVEIVAVSDTVWDYLKSKGYNSYISRPQVKFKNFLTHSRNTKKKVMLFVGQLGKYHKFKNLDLLIRAFSIVSREFPQWELWVVGDGNLFEHYVSLSVRLGIDKKVKFLGRITDEKKLFRLYSSSSLFVMPSSFDSFGLVVGEALSSGVPVVISPSVGAKILVEPGKNGIVLDDLKVSTLVRVLKYLLENPKLVKRMSILAMRKHF